MEDGGGEDGRWRIEDGESRMEDGGSKMGNRGWKMEDGRGEKLRLATGRFAKIVCALDHPIEHRTHLLPHLI